MLSEARGEEKGVLRIVDFAWLGAFYLLEG